jgi:hypothetical protein
MGTARELTPCTVSDSFTNDRFHPPAGFCGRMPEPNVVSRNPRNSLLLGRLPL